MSNQAILNSQPFVEFNQQLSKILALRGYLVETPAEQVDPEQLARLQWDAFDASGEITRTLESSTFEREIVIPLAGGRDKLVAALRSIGILGEED